MKLPERFILEMQELWQRYHPPGRLADFLQAMQQEPHRGIRVNPLKISPSDWLKTIRALNADLILDPVPWSSDGFYYSENWQPGRLPFYHAGLYYIQEPSAMLPAEVLNARPGERVLDLCAAPGGKTARLAASMQGQGLLWANEISPERAKALLRNVELMGCSQAVVSSAAPDRLAAQLPRFFDRILVDAPCSGSGMFRRDHQAMASWEKYGTPRCLPLQQEILIQADAMLKPGGDLVYSTCTFSLAEDEAMIQWFLSRFPQYTLCEIPKAAGISDGLALTEDMHKTARIWPHLAAGDGHFCAWLHQGDSCSAAAGLHAAAASWASTASIPDYAVSITTTLEDLDTNSTCSVWLKWCEKVLSPAGLEKMTRRLQQGTWRQQGDHLHILPLTGMRLPELKYLKTGLYLGQIRTVQQKRGPVIRQFDPAHAWLLTLTADDFRYSLRLQAGDPMLARYLRAETLVLDEGQVITSRGVDKAEAGELQDEPSAGAFLAVCLDEFPVGWAKMAAANQLKNLYPPGWRRLN